MNILFFGVLTDIVKAQRIEIASVSSTDELIIFMELKYHEIRKHNYQIVINQKKIEGNMSINSNDEIAFLPPFAGG